MTATPAADSMHSNALPVATTLGALGVVYGDIGTSPLYALKEAAKAAAHGGPLANDALASHLSFFLWNSPPDAPLLARAAAGDLASSAVLREQTERLLSDCGCALKS